MAKLKMGTVVVRGRSLTSVVCQSSRVCSRETKMQTTGLTFFDLDWAKKSAEGAICANCGYVHMFADDGLECTTSTITR